MTFKKAKEYFYQNEAGKNVLRIDRLEANDASGEKQFYQYHVALDGEWLKGSTDEEFAPFYYDLWKTAPSEEMIFLVEGEKCVDALIAQGVAATTTPGGAQSWKPSFAKFFAQKKVIIIPDADKPGRKYAIGAFRDLRKVCASVHILELPNLRESEDVVDWLDRGGAKEELHVLAETTATTKVPSSWEKECLSAPIGLRLNDLLTQDIPAQKWLVEGLLPLGGVSILASRPKVGKSTLARFLSVQVARGMPFLGRATHRGSTLYYALEEIRAPVKDHYSKMLDEGESIEDILVFFERCTTGAIEHLREHVAHHKPALVILDTIARFTTLADFNDYSEVSAIMGQIVSIARELDTHIMLVHHRGKSDRQGADSTLGSTAFTGSVDVTITLEGSDGHGLLISTEQRYGIPLQKTIVSRNDPQGTFSIGILVEESETETAKEQILDVLRANGPQSGSDLIQKVSGDTNRTKSRLNELVRAGTVIRAGKGSKGEPYIYRTAEMLDWKNAPMGEIQKLSIL